MFATFAFIEEYPDLVNTITQKPAAKEFGFIRTVHRDPVKNIYQQKNSKDELRQLPKKRAQARMGRSESLSWGQRGSSRGFSSRGSW
jgi:hypothetical protein